MKEIYAADMSSIERKKGPGRVGAVATDAST